MDMFKSKSFYRPLQEEIIEYINLSLAEIENVSEFGSLLRNYVSIHYPETEYSYGTNFINATLKNYENDNANTNKKSVWRILNFGNLVGYISTTIKKNNSVKINHCVLRPGYSNKGIASGAILELAYHYKSLGFFKIYATAPANHPAACGCLLSAGFFNELILKKHYSEITNELVFSKILNPQSMLASTEQKADIPKCTEDRDLSNYSINPCKAFYYEDQICGLASPKRGGAVKLQLLTFEVRAVEYFLQSSMQFLLQHNKRRVYSILPDTQKNLINLFLDENFTIEGKIQMQCNTDNQLIIAKFF